MRTSQKLRKGNWTTQRGLPTNLDKVIENHQEELAILINAGASREQITELLKKIQVTFYVPFQNNFSLPKGMTRKTLNGLVRRIDDLAGDLEKLNGNPTYALAALSAHLNDGAKKLVGDLPLEQFLSALPFFLRVHAALLKARRKMAGRIRMGAGKGHLPRNNFLQKLFRQLKQPLKASDYRSVGKLLDALVPENQGPIPAFEESRLRKLHNTVLKRAIQQVS
jgi:hypothetical protein